MLMFVNDYQEGAYEGILKALQETNLEQTVGYGEDQHCANAARMIKEVFACPDADVHFLVGGTQTNEIVITHILRPYQGVIAADTGHIATHETGAIEAGGHKVIALPNSFGKISAEQIDACAHEYETSETPEHVVMPAMVYISFPTEYGTMYTAEELRDIRQTCEKHGLYLYIDGARLGYALASDACDVAKEDIAKYCDAFYIGGTKQGALFGEALVITNKACGRFFRNSMKQRGALLAKGRLIGIQFEELMRDNAYFNIASSAVHEAMFIREKLIEKRIPVLFDSYTNQQFPCLSAHQVAYLREKCCFSVFGESEGKTVIRLCTSWATKHGDVLQLLQLLDQLPEVE